MAREACPITDPVRTSRGTAHIRRKSPSGPLTGAICRRGAGRARVCGLCARAGVDPGGFEAGVAEELGDDGEVCAAADERGRERVPEDVNGRVVVEAGGGGDAGDDVVGAADAEALPALVEEQG